MQRVARIRQRLVDDASGQTGRQTDILIAILRTPRGGEIINNNDNNNKGKLYFSSV